MKEHGMTARIASFAEFYPFYLTQHANRTCRRTHFIGSTLALVALAMLAWRGNAWWLLAALLMGYGGAWVGHFVYEKNRPASFAQPLYSLRADWVMYWQMLTGKLTW
jgi:hypothetical protein